MKSAPYKKLIAYALLSGILSSPMLAMAKDIPLLQEPNAGAASAGTADLSSGVIPIFTSKDGNWVKVGDPRNGNVGWVKAKDLSSGGEESIIFSHRISNSDKGTGSYQVFQFGTPAKLTPDQQMTLEKLQAQQEASSKAMQKAIQDMTNNMSMPGPIFMPVIVVPQQAVKAKE